MSGTVELFLDQGCTFNPTLTLTNEYGQPYDLTNLTVKSQMKKSFYNSNSGINLVTTISDDPTEGLISLYLDSANTANLSPKRYVFDVILTDNANYRFKVLDGLIYVNPGVTNFD